MRVLGWGVWFCSDKCAVCLEIWKGIRGREDWRDRDVYNGFGRMKRCDVSVPWSGVCYAMCLLLAWLPASLCYLSRVGSRLVRSTHIFTAQKVVLELGLLLFKIHIFSSRFLVSTFCSYILKSDGYKRVWNFISTICVWSLPWPKTAMSSRMRWPAMLRSMFPCRYWMSHELCL